MGFLKQKEYKVYAYTDRKSKKIAPYTSFLEREEFAKLFLKEGADIFMSLKGNANGIRSFEKQAEFNLTLFSDKANNLDKLLNLICTYPTEYKIPNMFQLINKEFQMLEKKRYLQRKAIYEEKEKVKKMTAAEFCETHNNISFPFAIGTDEEEKQKQKDEFLRDTKVEYLKTKNFVYREKTCIKANKTKVRVLTHLLEKEGKNSKEKLEYYYDQINNLLDYLFDFEENMFGVGKGVDKAVAEITGSKLAIKLDLKNFFNTVTKEQILKGFEESKFPLDQRAVKQLIRVGTPFGHPYQGGKLSTKLAYIALLPLIKELNQLDDFKKAVYIDDIFIQQPGSFEEGLQNLKKYKALIKERGFVLNEQKCKLLHGNKVFFLGVNLQTAQLGYNDFVKRLKPEMWRFYDTFFLARTPEGRNYKRRKIKEGRAYINTKIHEAQVIVGKLNYMKQINEKQFDSITKHHKYGVIYKKALETLSYVPTGLEKESEGEYPF